MEGQSGESPGGIQQEFEVQPTYETCSRHKDCHPISECAVMSSALVYKSETSLISFLVRKRGRLIERGCLFKNLFFSLRQSTVLPAKHSKIMIATCVFRGEGEGGA